MIMGLMFLTDAIVCLTAIGCVLVMDIQTAMEKAARTLWWRSLDRKLIAFAEAVPNIQIDAAGDAKIAMAVRSALDVDK